MKSQLKKKAPLPKFMLPCELSSSEKSNLLESINVCMFHLINEDKDQSLKCTGINLLILTAGQCTYRVNTDIISPTKQRVIVSGLPIQIISFQRQPPYKTPLLIKCCSYQSPFHQVNTNIKTNMKKTPNSSPVQVKCAETYRIPDWIEVTYLPHIRLLETGSKLAFNKLMKTCPVMPEFNKFQ